MNLQELDALAKGLAPVVARLIEAAVMPLRAEITALRAIEPVVGPQGAPGEKGAAGERGPAGTDAEPVRREAIIEALRAEPDLISEAVARHLETNPPAPGRDGVDGKDGAPGIDGKDGRDGADGKDGEAGVDGRDGVDGAPGLDGANGKDGLDGSPGEKGADGRDGRDGADIADILRTHDGRLVATMSDGRIKDLGAAPADGADGKDGEPGLAGRDGSDGRDGADGLGFEDLDLSFDGERKLVATFTRGEVSKAVEIEFPVVIDRGVYKAEAEYLRGDAATWAGSLWIAQRDVAPGEKPEGSDAWRLAVKRGRDGKDGKDGERGERGLKGEPGLNGRSYS